MISVSLLGPMSVKVNDRRVALSFGARGRRLAGYLLEFPGRVHRREQLSDMFWDDRPPQQARAAMNTALWRMRKLLAVDSKSCDFIQSSGDEIVFELGPSLQVDTHLFDNAVHEALDGGSVREPQAHAVELEQASSVYAGSFLDGEDADWIVTERERLHSLYIRCLCELMRTYAAIGDYEEAIAAGRRVLAADPFRETVMRTLAILLFMNGQRAQAIDELGRWKAALLAQVGVSALPETTELHAALRSGSICDEIARWRANHLASFPSLR